MTTPIFILSFNRYTMLKTLIDKLFQLKLDCRIVIIDNKSTYPPLLDYYNLIKNDVEILYMNHNYGIQILPALYNNAEFRNKYELEKLNYIYTDNDVVPIDECPSDIIEYFTEILNKYPELNTVGCHLKYDDFPEEFPKYFAQVQHDYTAIKIIDKTELYRAPIDTTFALRRACTSMGWSDRSLRTGFPYLIKHLPFYTDLNNLSDEDKFYFETAERSTVTSTNILRDTYINKNK